MLPLGQHTCTAKARACGVPREVEAQPIDDNDNNIDTNSMYHYSITTTNNNDNNNDNNKSTIAQYLIHPARGRGEPGRPSARGGDLAGRARHGPGGHELIEIK